MNSGCVICQDPFDAAVGIVTTKCGHVFHNICIERWLEQSFTCPECRSNTSTDNLTKLFFNTSFDNLSGNNVDRSLDVLKEQLMSKDLEIRERDETIDELQSYCESLESDAEKVHQIVIGLQHEVSVINVELKKLKRLDAKNEKLSHENNILQIQLEHLNNIKTIVEGCYNDAKKILADAQVHVCSEDGKIAAHKIATYCSAIKRELTCSVEEKNQLQNELTKIKRKMGILRANSSKKIRQLGKQVKMLKTLNLSSQSASCEASPTTVGVLKNHPSECGNLTSFSSRNDCKNQVTPISFDSKRNKKQKRNIAVLDKKVVKVSTQACETPVLRRTNSTLPQRRNPDNEDSVSRVRYNGLGGHGRIVKGSGAKKTKQRLSRKKNI